MTVSHFLDFLNGYGLGLEVDNYQLVHFLHYSLQYAKRDKIRVKYHIIYESVRIDLVTPEIVKRLVYLLIYLNKYTTTMIRIISLLPTLPRLF